LAQAAKFLFDDDFAAGNPATRPILPSEHALRLAESERKGFQDGFATAEKEANAAVERRTAIALEQIGGALSRIAGGLAAVETRLESEAIELAVAVARKLAPELVLRHPFEEIAALATDCLRQLSASPHVVVRVNDVLLETARTRLDEIARHCGFEGRLVVIAEPDIAIGDCRVEWADGGVVRTAGETDLAIGNAIERYIGARPPAGMPELGDINP
jgi:flagellar assembly protein FliH